MRAPLSRRAKGEPRDILRVLADGLAEPGDGDGEIFAGALALPGARLTRQTSGFLLFLEPETALPEKPTVIHRDGVRIERIDRIGLELGTQWPTQYHVEDNDPLSAVAELSDTQTLSRNEWQIRIETQLRMSSTGNAFILKRKFARL